MEVICNRVQEICKDWCIHSDPHDPYIHRDDIPCTSPGECVRPGMDFKDRFKVKCVKVKKRRGK